MRGVVQRVTRASVQIEDEVVGEIGRGLLVLIGVAAGDTVADAEWLADKIGSLRIFDDEQGRFDRDLADVNGALLVVSQFTLLGDARKGRRPNFSLAADPAEAKALYERFVGRLRESGHVVETGVFAARMNVHLVNDGPVTMVIDR